MTGDDAGITGFLERNRARAERQRRADPDCFAGLSGTQSPDLLWIGCSDSRVHPNEILDLPPGAVFVHRNIANVVVPSDLNVLSVLQYAVEELEIARIVVCGHHGCGGIRAALAGGLHGPIDAWLEHVREVRRLHDGRFAAPMSDGEREDLLCELNVSAQVDRVCETAIVRNAWARGRPVAVHGVVYSLKDGILHSLCRRTREGREEPAAP